MKVLLISSGSVSVHVSARVHQRLLDDGHEVMHFLTENAYTLWKQSGKWDTKKVMTYNETFEDECLRHFRDNKRIAHIQMVDAHDVCLVCPADFNIIGKLIMPDAEHVYPAVGTKVKQGDVLGNVGTVLKEGKLCLDIRNHNTSMLHMELRTESCHLDGWQLGGDRDKQLLDPTPYLHSKELKPCK